MFLANLIHLARKAALGIKAHLTFHRTTRELTGLSDHTLRDIGISRIDIQSIARAAALKATRPSPAAAASRQIASAHDLSGGAKPATLLALNDDAPRQMAS
ncbi:DUF1127 domain-containing protein [Bosea sp. RAC05]|uniref:DUF1127 domain-containing protein n=1 Tax=Bosea sp. RAC05 TaxID=1842539 RepID=UPI00083D3206|nr:DUF1127 domain-containing protein [Bosea sp. RAC05]AOG02983.1 hypothetical protein BSY19_4751 [Bosea sp. RAC05]